MLRRSFLTFLGAIGFATAIPALAQTRRPRTVDELIAWAEDRFSCVQGPPRAMVFLDGGDQYRTSPYSWVDLSKGELVGGDYAEWTKSNPHEYYVTYKWVGKTEEQAVRGIFNRLALFGGGTLYWRLAEKIELHEGNGQFHVRTRICVPGKTTGVFQLPLLETYIGPEPIAGHGA